jgi:hypothetical protein
MTQITLEGPNAKHAYQTTVVALGSISEHGTIAAGTQRLSITIHAFNRSAAAALARRNGYDVCDMNMIG